MSIDNDLRNITRIDQPPKSPERAGQHGWWVRMQKNGEKFHQFFNDNKYGGKEKTLVAAKSFRDAIKVEYTERLGRKSISPHPKASKRSVSGIVGVNRSSYEYQRWGKTYKSAVWQANWPLGNGRQTGTSFSIKKYGEEEAFRLALAAREKGIADSDKQTYLDYYPPENLNQNIWRYLDFAKFIFMLDSKSLYFPAASLFSDRFEGSYSKQNKDLRGLINKNKRSAESDLVDMNDLKRKVGISCWHANDYDVVNLFGTTQLSCFFQFHQLILKIIGAEIPQV